VANVTVRGQKFEGICGGSRRKRGHVPPPSQNDCGQGSPSRTASVCFNPSAAKPTLETLCNGVMADSRVDGSLVNEDVVATGVGLEDGNPAGRMLGQLFARVECAAAMHPDSPEGPTT
jgi:hypothetical protein